MLRAEPDVSKGIFGLTITCVTFDTHCGFLFVGLRCTMISGLWIHRLQSEGMSVLSSPGAALRAISGSFSVNCDIKSLRTVYAVYTLSWVARKYTQVISFRVLPEDAETLEAVRATFPEKQWGELMRWLFTHPDVERLMQQRLVDDVYLALEDSE